MTNQNSTPKSRKVKQAQSMDVMLRKLSKLLNQKLIELDEPSPFNRQGFTVGQRVRIDVGNKFVGTITAIKPGAFGVTVLGDDGRTYAASINKIECVS